MFFAQIPKDEDEDEEDGDHGTVPVPEPSGDHLLLAQNVLNNLHLSEEPIQIKPYVPQEDPTPIQQLPTDNQNQYQSGGRGDEGDGVLLASNVFGNSTSGDFSAFLQ